MGSVEFYFIVSFDSVLVLILRVNMIQDYLISVNGENLYLSPFIHGANVSIYNRWRTNNNAALNALHFQDAFLELRMLLCGTSVIP